MNGHRARALAAAVPLILINTVAFAGQLAFLRDHLPWPLAGQVTMAVALESIAVFLALHAHAAALADDSALRLRLASYAFAAVIGAMNYSHYALPGWRPTFPAAAVGLMSASSPWLWAVHSRRVSRDALLAKGLVEPHALRLGMTRWLWHPLRAGRVMWLATWDGVTDPREAVARWEAHTAGTHCPDAPADAAQTQHPDALGTHPRAALETHPANAAQTHPTDASGTHLTDAGRRASQMQPRNAPRRRTPKPVTDAAAETHFAAFLADGQVPSVRHIERELHVGRTRAQAIRQHLARQAFST